MSARKYWSVEAYKAAKKAADATRYARNRAKRLQQIKAWKVAHPERWALIQKRARVKSAPKIRIRVAQWRRENREKISAWRRKRYRTNIQHNLAVRTRTRINNALRTSRLGIKPEATIPALGCSYTELQQKLAPTLPAGFTWDDLLSGRLHLDHRRPVASFDLSDRVQFRQCFHWSNLQILTAHANLTKSALWP